MMKSSLPNQVEKKSKQAGAELCQAQLSLGQPPTNYWVASCDEKAYSSQLLLPTKIHCVYYLHQSWKINFPGWGWGWLDQLRIKPTQPSWSLKLGLSLAKIFCSKRSRVKKFGSKNIWVQIYFKIFRNLKKILVQLNFRSIKILNPKKIGPKIFGSRMIWV